MSRTAQTALAAGLVAALAGCAGSVPRNSETFYLTPNETRSDKIFDSNATERSEDKDKYPLGSLSQEIGVKIFSDTSSNAEFFYQMRLLSQNSCYSRMENYQQQLINTAIIPYTKTSEESNSTNNPSYISLQWHQSRSCSDAITYNQLVTCPVGERSRESVLIDFGNIAVQFTEGSDDSTKEFARSRRMIKLQEGIQESYVFDKTTNRFNPVPSCEERLNFVNNN